MAAWQGGDIIVGGTGAMTVHAQGGDAVFGNTTTSLTVDGSLSGPDSIIGGSGALTINGQGSNMFVVAGTSTSNINVGSGASVIFGSAGASTITGGTGYMEVIQGSGNMTIRQGTGPTVYDVVKGAAGGTDMLNGFNTALDTIRIFGYAAADLHVTKSGGSTLISLSDGTKINLIGVADPGHSIVS